MNGSASILEETTDMLADFNKMEEIKTFFEIESGAVATKIEGGQLKFLTIYRLNMNDYTLPKGHVEEDESLEITAKREVQEETGHVVEIQSLIDSFEYKVKEMKNGNEAYIIRRVYFFSAYLSGDTVAANNPDIKEGKIVPSWLTYEEAMEKFTYDTDKNIIRKVNSQNRPNDLSYVHDIGKELFERIKNNRIILDNLYKFGLVGSVNDAEFSPTWSDLDFLFVLKADELGNISIDVLQELRKINNQLSFKYPEIEISFLPHTYDDFQKYVAFEYLNHYKFALFLIDNDSIDFVDYIERIIRNRNINPNIQKRYAIYHLRHFRFNLLRKVLSTPDNKNAVKQIVDKLIETMILYLSYHGKTIKGKDRRLKELRLMNVNENINNIFEVALQKRENWKDVRVHNEEVEEWLRNFEEVANFLLKDNPQDTPEELINNA